ncbi:MAG TPA: MaoC/PaaZ C-terminal domain-containing protein [Pseudonocardia sp.]|uniref:MaoC/PaaZ C-terminal domain-containing protein n=1 Tax=Pseudonocardia sp. TaxID=60912 RepID=UPI002CB77279|nr:MaoC/PaaZ C-terminal domain-containing protein [Pseudonocardia sp.]HTF48522.1 MaoC/PaaZ C-terminal domain-containing protein [Pseudonocardia sp.]
MSATAGSERARTDLTDIVEGSELPSLSVRLTRTDLIRYAGASGDFNPIHWNDRVAESVELPGVVAHGMLTMALGGRLVTEWLGDPGAVLSYQARFTRPVPVPDVVDGVDDPTLGAVLELTGTVKSISVADDGARTARVDISAKFDGKAVLGRAAAVVRLPA